MITIITASILIGIIFAPLGCLVLWKRYVYFGDGLAHAGMLAGAISVIMGIPILYAGIVNTIIFAIAVFKLKDKSGNNAAIGLTANVMTSLALILSYFYPDKINIGNLLFGNIISTNTNDIIILCLLLAIVIVFLKISYKKLIILTLSKEIASSQGINVKLLELLFLVILSFAILTTIKIVGALLIVSIILIPAMTAGIFASTPLRMMILAVIFALIINFIGVAISFYADIPFAPVIILSGGTIYLTMLLFRKIIDL